MREGAVRRVLDGLQGSGTQAELQVSSSGQQNFHGFGGILQRVPFSQLQEAALEAKDEQRCPIWSKSKEVDCPAEHLLPQACELLPFLRSALGDANSSAWAQRLESVNLWASIGDTHSNLHYDSKHGLLIILRGSKVVEVFPPSSTLHLGAYPVHDPLRSHHSKVPHCCLAARLQGQRCTSGSSQCWPCFPKAQSFQAELHLGDALLIPEGWWHHVKTPACGHRHEPLVASVSAGADSGAALPFAPFTWRHAGPTDRPPPTPLSTPKHAQTEAPRSHAAVLGAGGRRLAGAKAPALAEHLEDGAEHRPLGTPETRVFK
eukprot:g1806.t2